MSARGLSVIVVDTLPERIGGIDNPALTVAWRIRRLERDTELRKLERRGVPVVAWRGRAASTTSCATWAGAAVPRGWPGDERARGETRAGPTGTDGIAVAATLLALPVILLAGDYRIMTIPGIAIAAALVAARRDTPARLVGLLIVASCGCSRARMPSRHGASCWLPDLTIHSAVALRSSLPPGAASARPGPSVAASVAVWSWPDGPGLRGRHRRTTSWSRATASSSSCSRCAWWVAWCSCCAARPCTNSRETIAGCSA